MTSNQIQLTKEGYKALKEELEQLVDVKRPKMVERLAFARTQGDLSENSDYTNAREDLDFLDGRILELEGVLTSALVVKGGSNGRSTQVSLGAKVKLKVNGNECVYHIVGEWEADPNEKKISHNSPLGRALVGKGVGEKVEVEAPAGKIVYEILGIE